MKKILLIGLLFFLLAPVTAQGQTSCSAKYSGSTLCNALPSFGGVAVTNIPQFITAVFAWLAGIVGTLALVMVIYSGAQMIFSRGESAAVTKAKTSLAYSLIGLLVIVMAYVIVSVVQGLIGYDNTIEPGKIPGGTMINPIDNPLSSNDLLDFLRGVVRTVLGMMGTVTMLYIIFSGFRYMTAGSNEEQAKKSRAGLSWAIIGLISVILSYLIVTVVINLLK